MPGDKKNQIAKNVDRSAKGQVKPATKRSSTPKSKATPTKKSTRTVATTKTGPVIHRTNQEADLRQRIAIRAFELYQERCRIGAQLQDWLRAEREILAMIEYERGQE